MVAKLGQADTVFALVFPGLVSAFGTFFLRQAYMGIPNEIGEAAYLDGCNQWQAFTKVMFPLTSSSVAALSVFTAVFAYGDLMWPLVVNSDLKMMTLSSGLATLRGQFSTNFPVLMTGSLLFKNSIFAENVIPQNRYNADRQLRGNRRGVQYINRQPEKGVFREQCEKARSHKGCQFFCYMISRMEYPAPVQEIRGEHCACPGSAVGSKPGKMQV